MKTTILTLLLLSCTLVNAQSGAIDTVRTPDGVVHLNKMPEYPGGQEGFNAALQKHFKLPKAAKKDGIHGLVIVEIMVDENGKITEPKVLKSLREDIDAAALQAVEELQPFSPATMDSEPVPFGIKIPFRI